MTTIPIAQFSASPITGATPLNVTFKDTSINIPTSWLWDFGDNTTSVIQHPVHSYANAGTFSVTLTSTNAAGKSLPNTKTSFITVSTPIATATPIVTVTPTQIKAVPIIAIMANILTGVSPLTVQFTGTATNTPTNWAWDFGDGNKINVANNTVSNTYNNPGTFNVNVTATNAAGISAPATKIIVVTAPNNGTITEARFTATPSTGYAPLTVNFNDLSTGNPIGWSWDFGDGSELSELQNPVHTYRGPGSYTVILLTTNPGGSNKTLSTTITVSESILSTIYNKIMENWTISLFIFICIIFCLCMSSTLCVYSSMNK